MEFKKGNNAIYLGESQENFDAIVEYRQVEEGLVDAYHTRVKDELGGQGIGKKLIAALAERARQEGFKIKASCWYAEKVLSENEEYKDVYYRG